jgi:hypothetical protein
MSRDKHEETISWIMRLSLPDRMYLLSKMGLNMSFAKDIVKQTLNWYKGLK